MFDLATVGKACAWTIFALDSSSSGNLLTLTGILLAKGSPV
jgi:hypothetical protein